MGRKLRENQTDNGVIRCVIQRDALEELRKPPEWPCVHFQILI